MLDQVNNFFLISLGILITWIMNGFVGRSNRLIASRSQRVNQPKLALPNLYLSTQVVGVLVPTAFTTSQRVV